MSEDIKPILARVADGHFLSADEVEKAFNIIGRNEPIGIVLRITSRICARAHEKWSDESDESLNLTISA